MIGKSLKERYAAKVHDLTRNYSNAELDNHADLMLGNVPLYVNHSPADLVMLTFLINRKRGMGDDAIVQGLLKDGTDPGFITAVTKAYFTDLTEAKPGAGSFPNAT